MSVIEPELSRAHTLPADFYVNPAVLAQEKERIFARTWQIVGNSQQVLKTGDYFTTQLVGEPLLIVRDTEGKLRGYYNVCKHRAGPPAQGCGNRKVFRCGYHGWTYGLDGHLMNAPEMEGTGDFDHKQFGLTPVRLEEWNNLIFVNLDDRAEPLMTALRELPQQTEKFGLGRMQLYQRRDYVMDCNWKVYLDNFLEGYHLPSVHPGLNRELDYGNYFTKLYERHSLQSSPIRGPENESTVERRYNKAEGDLAAEYYWIFPNWMLNCYPDNLSINIVLPLAPEKTVAIFEWYFLPEVLKTDVPQTTVKFSDEIQIEDGAICETVHRNLKSRSYDRGRYSVKQEKGLHHFHKLYAGMMEI